MLCMSVLSLAAVARAAVTRRDTVRVAYGTLPRYLRFAARVPGLSEQRLTQLIGATFRTSIGKIRHGDDVPEYPRVNFEAMEDVVPLTLGLEPLLRRNPWVRASGALIGHEEAVSLAFQAIAYRWIWPQLLQIRASAAQLAENESLEISLPASLPAAWIKPAQAYLPRPVTAWHEWPGWVRRLTSFVGSVSWLIVAAFDLVRTAAMSTVRPRHAVPPGVKLLSELADPRCLGGSAHDSDYWVDGHRLQAPEFALFVVTRQEELFRRKGFSRDQVERSVQAMGYKLVWCRGLAVPVNALMRMARAWAAAWAGLWNDAFASASVMSVAWRGHRELAPVFIRGRAEACLYIKEPFGEAEWRQDSAIVTGLCRLAGIRSTGCQMRVVYGGHYEFAFDCYDLMCRWGSAWFVVQAEAMRGVARWAEVGSLTLGKLLSPAPARESEGRRRVLVFTADVGSEHSTLGYNLAMLQACCDLAERHPLDLFQVKTKDPGHVDRFLADPALARRLERLTNVQFVKQERHDYAALMRSADRVIALGFTTPGAEGLMLGRPSFYFNRLGRGGGMFRAIPNCVVETSEELCAAYEWAAAPSADALFALDPFRDGSARDRILAEVLRWPSSRFS